MKDLETLFAMVSKNRIYDSEIADPKAVISQLLSMDILSDRSIQVAIVHVLLRLLESNLLTDAVLLDISKYPGIYLGRADTIISARIEERFGFSPPRELVYHLRKCLQSHTIQKGEKAGISDTTFDLLISARKGKSADLHLRCDVCGYAFRECDVGETRLALIQDHRFALAQKYHPRREVDVFKPIGKTKLEVDHIVPEEGYGWTSNDNLQVTCQFCNQGRLIFRRSLEPLSTMAAGATSAYPTSRGSRITLQVIAVSAIDSADGICRYCNASKNEREMTVRLRPNSPSEFWCVPWNLDVLCYECIDI